MNNKLIYEPQGKSRSCFVVREYRRQRDTLEESKLVFFIVREKKTTQQQPGKSSVVLFTVCEEIVNVFIVRSRIRRGKPFFDMKRNDRKVFTE